MNGLNFVRNLVVFLIAVGVVGGLIFFFNRGPVVDSDVLTHVVAIRTIHDKVVEHGTLESQKTVEGKCELPGGSKITFIVPEGTTVKKGDEVVRLDSEKLDQAIDEKKIEVNEAERKVEESTQEIEVQENKNEGDISTAEFELEQAKLNLEKYKEGEFNAEVSDFERSIAEGEAELEKNLEKLESYRALVKKGYRSPEQLREQRLLVTSAQHRLERDKQKLFVLKEYESKQKLSEYEHAVSNGELKLKNAKSTAEAELRKAKSELERAEYALELEKQELKELEDKRNKCKICAPQNGTVAYANKRWFDADERIREGADVWEGRAIFYLPDMDKMQVSVNIHESVVNKVAEGQNAIIRISSFPDQVFDGTVKRVSQLANSSWYRSTQNYQAVVLIDSIPEGISLKPGMTAEVEIQVGTYRDIVAVPVNTVTEHFQQSYVYVRNGNMFARRQVEVGRTTNSFIEIKSGINEGEVLALDAYHRGMTDFGDAEKQAKELEADEKKAETPEGGPVIEG